MFRTPARLSAVLLAAAGLVFSGAVAAQIPQAQRTIAGGCCSELR